MLDHIGFAVSDFARSRAFYERALAPLGFAPVMDVTREQSGDYEGTGFGPPETDHLELPEDAQRVADRCRPYYEQLAAHCLQP